ncbi:MAG: hypothetical protein KC503_04385 [Myxococcales bacterium]|nr:hypothetical protein [Myxococcales bacterium]
MNRRALVAHPIRSACGAVLLCLLAGCPGKIGERALPDNTGARIDHWIYGEQPPGGGSICTIPEYYCPGGKICFQGFCNDSVCVQTAKCPNPGGKCKVVCTPVEDACASVNCEAGSSCVGGRCVKGCFDAPCAHVTCGAGRICSNGACLTLAPETGAQCPPGTAAAMQACAENPCAGVSCAQGEICVGGTCIKNTCAGVTCEPGFYCSNGKCVDSCAGKPGGPPTGGAPKPPACVKKCSVCGEADGCGGTCTTGSCPQGEACKQGKCECVPDCIGKFCNDDNGCGGKCKGCPPDQICDQTNITWLCCTPDCAGKACGAPDGCGGICGDGSCAASNELCKKGTCVCQPDCTAKACGDDNGCGGTCKNCSSGQRCIASAATWSCCTPSCTGKACGASDGCGGTCKQGSCAGGLTCKSGKCVCIPQCAGKACGAADGCGGVCAGSCPSGQSCKSGQCVPLSCPCGKQLVGASCVDICSSGTTLCGCTTCCGPGTNCDFASATCKPVN